MTIILLKPITGRGEFADGSTAQFTLEPGALVDVEADQGVRWCALGIGLATQTDRREAAQLQTPETTARPRPAAKPRKRISSHALFPPTRHSPGE